MKVYAIADLVTPRIVRTLGWPSACAVRRMLSSVNRWMQLNGALEADGLVLFVVIYNCDSRRKVQNTSRDPGK